MYEKKIMPLTSMTEKLVKEGIFGLYNSFLDLLENSPQSSYSPAFSELLQETVDAIEPILRDYFLIKKMDNMI